MDADNTVQYTQYENLEENVKIPEDLGDWKNQFQYIDALRSINKHQQGDFKIDEYWEQISPLCDSLRSNVQKNALMLIRETIQYQNVFEFKILQKVFEKCESDFKFLKNEAIQTVEMISSKPFSQELANTLCQITIQNNYKLQTYSYPALVKIILTSDFNCEWEPILQATFLVCEGKSVECRKGTDQLYQALLKQKPNLVEQDSFKVIALRHKQKQPQRSFKEFKQQLKQQ